MSHYHSIVLLVDDQKVIHLGLKKMLQDEDDIVLHFCKDGRQAVATALQLKPTVILQDITMPNINGLELLQQYRNHDAISDTPVLMLSATDTVEVKADAFQQGADDYLVKMPHKVELLARIRHHTKAYMEHQEREIAMRQLKQEKEKLALAYQELERDRKSVV